MGLPRQSADQPRAGTAIDFALKLIDLVAGKEKAREVTEQMVLAAGIYDYRD
ncbi:4-methyl-5(B-hydroxyethyl)-thiazole monophosphate biosynthesis enzyme domain protein [Candidatus Erwinia dacicola]|uniref:4-methyl-5(B-hydroxyethyl)-thiazole monophosphate biosynthesis enzyme domain protein n=1 Tax=Candidatus Erwinia dacicola TaxID=252393 RepID=A0A328TMB1_9GAMM|nr:4-methyl-5(B-hydroxyethyl)-thiazole monophosphate biosynthesis enzyme domain protein [Candidatus Erwinia dacicola]